ncbi:MAG: hypothetical protein HQ555_11850 [Candidatus Aminicenantes bacterium]|nr:hypothetical protein [Candidatus Aminicenantes bacterium]
MKKILLKFFFLFIAVMIITGVSIAAKIHLKNGVIIQGEIIDFDDTSVNIKDPLVGMVKISRGRIKKIEPPLEIKAKKKKARAEISGQEDPYDMDYPAGEWKKKSISIYLGGGLLNINGSDLNGMIGDWNEAYEDYDDYFPIADFSADWAEIKRLQNYKGEILFNLNPSWSIGFGIEYLTHEFLARDNIRELTYSFDESGTEYETGYYYDWLIEADDLWEPEYTLAAIPLTFNVYFYIPSKGTSELFITAGIGYYFGKLKYNETYEYVEGYQEDYYGDDDTYWYSWIEDYSYEGTYSYEAKCQTIGFHGGIGINFRLTSNIFLVVEGNYRYVNFKNWEGNGSDNWSWDWEYGWSDLGFTNESEDVTEEWEGKIWYWEYDDPDTLKQYKRISLLEEKPEADVEIKNVRPAEINLNGFSLRVGIKISF